MCIRDSNKITGVSLDTKIDGSENVLDSGMAGSDTAHMGIFGQGAAATDAQMCIRDRPEALLCTDIASAKALETELEWADAVVIGPGLSKSDNAKMSVETVLKTAEIPLVIDADALNIISDNMTLLNEHKDVYKRQGKKWIYYIQAQETVKRK